MLSIPVSHFSVLPLSSEIFARLDSNREIVLGAGNRPILRPKCGRIKNLTIFWEYRVKMISNPVSHFPVLPLSSEIFARLNSFREIVVGAGN